MRITIDIVEEKNGDINAAAMSHGGLTGTRGERIYTDLVMDLLQVELPNIGTKMGFKPGKNMLDDGRFS